MQFLNLLCTGKVDNDAVLKEASVFEENYALLHNTILDVIDHLIQAFVENSVFIGEEERQISIIAKPEKLQLVLQKTSTSLKNDDTRTFYMTLMVMQKHGGKATQALADHIIQRLNLTADELLQICDLNQNREECG